MERQGDGDEPVGILKKHNSAEEPGKSALFPQRFFSFFCQILREYDDDDLCALAEKERENKALHLFALNFLCVGDVLKFPLLDLGGLSLLI